MTLSRPTLVIVGAASRDVDVSDARGWRLGGTVTYSALAAAHLGVQVLALVGVDADSESARELAVLADAGVEVVTVRLDRGPIFDNRQTPAGRVQDAISASDLLPSTALPDGWRNAEAVLLGPVAGELDDTWADAFPVTTTVGFAAQGALRQLTPGSPVERIPIRPSALWTRADRILISAEDIVPGSPDLEALLHPGQKLVVTHGERGALYVERTERGTAGRYLPPAPRRTAVDTTGAGDTFLAAWLAGHMLLPGAAEWRALLLASVMASVSVERATLPEAPTKRDVCDVLVMLRDRHLD